jgi:hypothetical protein
MGFKQGKHNTTNMVKELTKKNNVVIPQPVNITTDNILLYALLYLTKPIGIILLPGTLLFSHNVTCYT